MKWVNVLDFAIAIFMIDISVVVGLHIQETIGKDGAILISRHPLIPHHLLPSRGCYACIASGQKPYQLIPMIK
jgi:hypothetical protein